MISLDAVSKGYGGQELLRGMSWRIGRGERIGLVGPNGPGKTTLCRILAGVEEPDAGRVHRDTGVTVGYLPQEVTGGEDRTVLAEALSGFDEVWRLEARLESLAARMAGPDAPPGLTDTYGEIMAHMKKAALPMPPMSWEVYLGDPETTPPGDLVTEIYLPVP